jgi:hypothetical protein
MARALLATAAIATCLVARVGSAWADDFEPVDPAALDSVSGTRLVAVAYGVILGLVLVYALVLMLRDRAVRRAAERLQHRLDSTKS